MAVGHISGTGWPILLKFRLDLSSMILYNPRIKSVAAFVLSHNGYITNSHWHNEKKNHCNTFSIFIKNLPDWESNDNNRSKAKIWYAIICKKNITNFKLLCYFQCFWCFQRIFTFIKAHKYLSLRFKHWVFFSLVFILLFFGYNKILKMIHTTSNNSSRVH